MPPGRRGGPMLGASLTGILNSDARSDEESQRRTVRIFGSILGLLLCLDVVGSFFTLYLTCHASASEHDDCLMDNHQNQNHTTTHCLSKCLVHSIKQGIHLHPISEIADHSTDGEFGDLFFLALIRSALTLLFLWIGVRYGSYAKVPSATNAEEEQPAPQTCTIISEEESNELSTTHCLSKCLVHSIKQGIHLHPISKIADHSTNGEFGDLFFLAL
eukprot:CAMPEP_0113661066 /NCGR_PEP_ID=MMETSP0017_2-20120614/33232_1 /TAXON_ID=2856 /ORGANISM="Cylindrotheca closterium" /LENGTH=215 /DNA_ID=CAMNT_0000575737 /DNA_START=23 /DNA_END=667 /DNA_ORIENTATION=- /assembly_acc=CAM_ASM_000147